MLGPPANALIWHGLDRRAPDSPDHEAVEHCALNGHRPQLVHDALRPLERCKQKYSKIDHLVVRFSALKSFVVFSWHLFPFVWFLGYLGLVNSMQVRLGLLICDVIAKFLPVSLYISSMTD